MNTIGSLAGINLALRPQPGGRAQGGFSVPDGAAAARTSAAAPMEMVGLLSMQEAGEGAVRDREARRHGRALLDALAGLQRSLLAAKDDPDALRRLSQLATSGTEAHDPALRGAVRAIALRAQVELARRGM